MNFAEDDNEARIAEDLVGRIQAGDSQAEETLVKRYSYGLLTLLRHRTNDPDLSDDLHQETLLLVIRKIRENKIGEPAKLAGYIHRVCRNLLIETYRKRTRRGEAPASSPDRLPSAELDPSLRYEKKDEVRLVRMVLAELKIPRDREILYRFYLAEQGKEEILAILGIDSLHFNRVLHRARRRFSQLWEKRRPNHQESSTGRATAQVFILIWLLLLYAAITRLESTDFL